MTSDSPTWIDLDLASTASGLRERRPSRISLPSHPDDLEELQALQGEVNQLSDRVKELEDENHELKKTATSQEVEIEELYAKVKKSAEENGKNEKKDHLAIWRRKVSELVQDHNSEKEGIADQVMQLKKNLEKMEEEKIELTKTARQELTHLSDDFHRTEGELKQLTADHERLQVEYEELGAALELQEQVNSSLRTEVEDLREQQLFSPSVAKVDEGVMPTKDLLAELTIGAESENEGQEEDGVVSSPLAGRGLDSEPETSGTSRERMADIQESCDKLKQELATMSEEKASLAQRLLEGDAALAKLTAELEEQRTSAVNTVTGIPSLPTTESSAETSVVDRAARRRNNRSLQDLGNGLLQLELPTEASLQEAELQRVPELESRIAELEIQLERANKSVERCKQLGTTDSSWSTVFAAFLCSGAERTTVPRQ